MSELLRVGPADPDVLPMVLAERRLPLGSGWLQLVATQRRGQVRVVLIVAATRDAAPVELNVCPIRDLLTLATMFEQVAHAAGAPR